MNAEVVRLCGVLLSKSQQGISRPREGSDTEAGGFGAP
jgi:hypothetical protein